MEDLPSALQARGIEVDSAGAPAARVGAAAVIIILITIVSGRAEIENEHPLPPFLSFPFLQSPLFFRAVHPSSACRRASRPPFHISFEAKQPDDNNNHEVPFEASSCRRCICCRRI